MGSRADADLGQRQGIATGGAGDADALGSESRLLGFEGARQLVEEQGNAVLKLGLGRGTTRAAGDLALAPRDQLFTIVDQELMHAVGRER